MRYPMILLILKSGKIRKEHAGDRPEKEYETHCQHMQYHQGTTKDPIVEVQLIEVVMSRTLRE